MYPTAQETFNEADSALDYKISQLCFEGPEEKLKLTEITQPAILIVSAATFYTRGRNDVAEIQDAYKLLSPLLGMTGASTLFALALLASGEDVQVVAGSGAFVPSERDAASELAEVLEAVKPGG